ncbi:anaphase-promoting complex subunit 10 isoform X1 [Paramuricea clavata]|uniref:Anaphase-promoting complex subunit 10 n=1 Tax=Paramuricea clavata TaxID=317549 RepID=A0A6S7HKW0_PARCT|nr:anaphase-promoting complex subunit 10 isoform X1 [Paramuricea clavata]
MAAEGAVTAVVENESKVILQPTLNEKLREIGHQAIWSLSSCKPGFGVEQLRDGNLDTYWQSDGPQPHLVNVKFRRKTLVQNVCIFVDYKSDESYTPSKISIRAGNSLDSLKQIDIVELDEPSGWLVVPVGGCTEKPLKTFMIQIAVLTNHQNGRDTHMRQIKLHAPPNELISQKMPNYTTVEFAMYSTIR